MPKFSIIIPTYDHGKLISWAIESVQHQTESNWELFVIGDGSPQLTNRVVTKYQHKDPRIHFIAKPKGPGNGEVYRDEVIRKTQGKYIVYLSDDDMFFPDHLELLAAQFKKGYNFINSLAVKVTATQNYFFLPVDLKSEYYSLLLRRGENRIPLSNAAHTKELYLKLPHGWRTTPAGVPTDLCMWQQFLKNPDLKPSTILLPTVLNFASPERKSWPTQKRSQELKRWYQKIIREPQQLRQDLALALFERIAEFEPQAVKNSAEKDYLNQILDSKIGWAVKLYFKLKSFWS